MHYLAGVDLIIALLTISNGHPLFYLFFGLVNCHCNGVTALHYADITCIVRKWIEFKFKRIALLLSV